MSTETLQIEKGNAIAAFNKTNPEGKLLLINLFGYKALSQKISDLINDFNDILLLSGKEAKDYEARPGETVDELASRKWKLIALVYNENKVPKLGQTRYFPYAVEDKSSGFGLSLTMLVGWSTFTAVGVRLCFFDQQHAKDAYNKFTQIYADMQIN
jgi:hypothetical protein